MAKKTKKTGLEWMMWQIEKSQMSDPPLVNLVRAMEYFSEKYGQIPNRCEIAKDWGTELVAPRGMVVTASKSVRPGYLMLASDPELGSQLPGKARAIGD